MRRLVIGVAAVLVAVGFGASPAQATDVGGTYTNSHCHIRSTGWLEAHLLTPGTVTGSGFGGSVAGTCGGSPSATFVARPSAKGLLIVEPHDTGVLHLGCQVSVNGGPSTAIVIDANVVGLVPSIVVTEGEFSQVGSYTAR